MVTVSGRVNPAMISCTGRFATQITAVNNVTKINEPKRPSAVLDGRDNNRSVLYLDEAEPKKRRPTACPVGLQREEITISAGNELVICIDAI